MHNHFRRLPTKDFSAQTIDTYVACSVSLNVGLFLTGLYLMAQRKTDIGTKHACVPQGERLIHPGAVITAQPAARVHFCPSSLFLTTSMSFSPQHFFLTVFVSLKQISPKEMATVSSVHAVSPHTNSVLYRY